MFIKLHYLPNGEKVYYASTDDHQYDATSPDVMGAVWDVANKLEAELSTQSKPEAPVNSVNTDNLGRPRYSYFDGGQHYHIWKLIASYGDGRREWVCRERYAIGTGLVTDCDCSVITFR